MSQTVLSERRSKCFSVSILLLLKQVNYSPPSHPLCTQISQLDRRNPERKVGHGAWYQKIPPWERKTNNMSRRMAHHPPPLEKKIKTLIFFCFVITTSSCNMTGKLLPLLPDSKIFGGGNHSPARILCRSMRPADTNNPTLPPARAVLTPSTNRQRSSPSVHVSSRRGSSETPRRRGGGVCFRAFSSRQM